MKWVNHQLVTTVLVYAATDSILYAGYSFLGSVLPDILEGRPPKESKAYWKWRSKHRKNTHWTVPYLAIIALLLYLNKEAILIGWYWEFAKIPLFVAVGSLLHILEDSICGKVPLFSRKKKIGIKLFRVGSGREYLVAYAICLAALYYRWVLN